MNLQQKPPTVSESLNSSIYECHPFCYMDPSTWLNPLHKSQYVTSFTVKNLGGNLPEKKFTIVKRNFRSSTKHLSLNSTIFVDELTTETFYCFRTSELFNIWMPPFLLHGSQYVTNFFARISVRDSLTNLKKMLAANFFTSSTMKIKKHLVTKP